MALTAFNVLLIVAGILAIVAMIRPAWPLCPVAVFLICVALLFLK